MSETPTTYTTSGAPAQPCQDCAERGLLAEVDALRAERDALAVQNARLRRTTQRRDKHATDRLRALRRKLRNVKAEVVVRAARVCFWKQDAKSARDHLRQHYRQDGQERVEQYRTTQALAVALRERDAFRSLSTRHLDRLRELEEVDKAHAECPTHIKVLTEQLERLTKAQAVLGIPGLLADIRRQTTAYQDAMVAVTLLARRSPFFVTIDPKGDVEICQFCCETRRHAPDCPWLLVEAIAAGKPAIPTPAMVRALEEADEALTAIFNSHLVHGDLIVQVDRAISACRAAGTKLPWPGETDGGWQDQAAIIRAVSDLIAAMTGLRSFAQHNRGCYERMVAGNATCDCGFAAASDGVDAASDALARVLGPSEAQP